jgi:hypothetical protein
MKEIKYTSLYCVCEITVPVPVPLRQKVTVPMVPVPGRKTLVAGTVCNSLWGGGASLNIPCSGNVLAHPGSFSSFSHQTSRQNDYVALHNTQVLHFSFLGAIFASTNPDPSIRTKGVYAVPDSKHSWPSWFYFLLVVQRRFRFVFLSLKLTLWGIL